MPEFVIGERDFLLDGHPIQLLSGALHYFRVHPDLWADRIDKARRMGLNTIETYVAWNAHAPKPGMFDLTGGLDLDRFLRLVAEAGMFAIVRPGPYICAEWDNGGLPAWLFRDPEVGVRRYEPRYLAAVRDYLAQALGVVAPHQIERGGPVVLVQVENEYGAFGADQRYLAALVDDIRAAGITVPLTTVDQADDAMLAAGGLAGVHRTASFGSAATERLAMLRAHQPTGPLMCSEFWNGWFDHWGERHHTTPADRAAADLEALLAAGASVNLYMFHGGTNFGLCNGANHTGGYRPLVTSYDYDAPLDEAGHPTAKYHAFRAVIARHRDVPGPAPGPAPPAPEFAVPLTDPVALLADPSRWGTWQRHERLPTLDDLDPAPRLALLRTRLPGTDPGVLVFGEVRDRVAVFLDGAPVGILHREHGERAIPLPRGSGELVLLLEDQGRVNYGPHIGEPKGIIGGAVLHGRPLTGWDVLPLDLDRPPNPWPHGPAGQPPPTGPVAGPVLLRAAFDLDEPADLYLDTGAWGKGMAWLNGFPLGRYWRRGPQRTLYVPAPATAAGTNHLVIFENEVLLSPTARFLARPDLGPTDP
ncbi:glycoside hydrolase family 35 protein [Actinophytocola sp.]|uniref:glycoside hydrolase family 35 protein n=1 Tax=Actinophytocola sp. TaxID=1872138 RepID=UPI002D80859E|nr:glycoside hydrolase family 35 protein [Actinophytocola sp.]HET9144231.1 glycoside hydrolase family 35 protein [Actinophytocola sp.]